MMGPAGKAAGSFATRNRALGAALVVGIMGIGLVPLAVKKSREDKSLFASEQPLTGSQIMRGNYINSGSKDIGPDPDYDFHSASWKGRRNDPFKK
jgi:hypothetical protein